MDNAGKQGGNHALGAELSSEHLSGSHSLDLHSLNARIEKLYECMVEAGEIKEGASNTKVANMEVGATNFNGANINSTSTANTTPLLEGEYVLEQKMKLAGKSGTSALFCVPSNEDWMHDCLGSSMSIAGTFYAADEPFLPGSTALDGYFQADGEQGNVSNMWVRVKCGKAELSKNGEVAWKKNLECFPEVAEQLSNLNY